MCEQREYGMAIVKLIKRRRRTDPTLSTTQSRFKAAPINVFGYYSFSKLKILKIAKNYTLKCIMNIRRPSICTYSHRDKPLTEIKCASCIKSSLPSEQTCFVHSNIYVTFLFAMKGYWIGRVHMVSQMIHFHMHSQ